ncbi:hypothetical protein [Hwangdonia seohaensis]|uniref:N-acetyltransferase domain-containing protein n=1 Tax=Hwangdonia seohaensis TaxID=1240727 RepID=A0ABW3REH2_9FLAO|nr:hypothetical protein [Hwangdonia seohaensis]
MKTKESQNTPTLKKYYNVVKNGLFLFGLRNRLANIGIDINPYYWVEEEYKKCEVPKIKDDASQYTLKYLTHDQIKSITRHYGTYYKDILQGLEKGQLCVGLEHHGEIACYTFIDLKDFEFKGRVFKLKPHEAYLLNMWTFNAYRGKNLAPYLRYQTYRLLEERGVTTKYSITQYFNKSSIKFKNKLNSKNHFLYLSVVLFKKFQWNFTLKTY